MLRREELTRDERRACIPVRRYVMLDEVDEIKPAFGDGYSGTEYLVYIRPHGPTEPGITCHVDATRLAPYLDLWPKPPVESQATCLTCGKRKDQHYSFALHEGEDPISVCAPGQYARRWRPAPEAGERRA